MAAKSFVKIALTNAAVAAVLVTAMSSLVSATPDGATTPELQERSRSKFEYHNGSAEEKRRYRQPNADVDPTNLRYEELIARLNALEERVEMLERHSSFSKRVQ